MNEIKNQSLIEPVEPDELPPDMDTNPFDKKIEITLTLKNPKQVAYKDIDNRSISMEAKQQTRAKFGPKTLQEDIENQKTGIERRLEDSNKKLNSLIEFGDEIVTNIRVANEKRELLRRNYESEKKEALLGDLEKESIEAIAKFNEITTKWSELNAIKEPMGLFEELNVQKNCISDLMKQKDDIIQEIQNEIKRVDEKYSTDQEIQSTDLLCLVERIDNQVRIIKTAYKEHLELLEQTISNERINVSLAAHRKFEEFREKMDENENFKYKIETERKQFYAEEIKRITREQEEITRTTRVRLDKDTDALQLELRATKNNVIINSEKLDYSYQVLQKKNEEHGIINNQQKRRVGKTHETISLLKKKVSVTSQKNGTILSKINRDVVNLHSSINELEFKSEQFRKNNEKRYANVWDINYKEAMVLMNKVLDVDRILHEQQLGIQWDPPNVPFEKKLSFECKERKPKKSDSKSEINSRIPEQNVNETRLLRNVIRKISDKAGFLVEDKLLKILEPFPTENKHLVRIDSIFNALRINNVDDISSLNKYFLPYTWCPNCSDGMLKKEAKKLFSFDFDLSDDSLLKTSQTENLNPIEKNDEKEIKSESKENEDLSEISADPIDQHIDELIKGEVVKEKCTKENTEDCQTSLTEEEIACTNHYLVIEPAMVLTALRQFTEGHFTVRTEENNENKTNENKTQNRSFLSPTKHTRAEVKKIWSSFLAALPEEKFNLWKSLEHGLNNYLIILREREVLDNKCEALRKQNNELQFLLQKYLKK